MTTSVIRAFRTTAWLAVLILGGCAQTPKVRQADWQRFEFEEPQMGVPFRIVLHAPDPATAQAAARAAFGRVAELNARLSNYETESELSLLSRSSEEGSPAVPVSDELWTVLQAAQKLAVQTGGAFDVTVGPLSALWRNARREKQLPEAARIESALQKVGYQSMVLNAEGAKGTKSAKGAKNRTVQMLKPGMRLDLGGIAKGYAADQALAVLRSMGIKQALVAASGDLALGDAPPGKSGWSIEIAGFDREDGPASGYARLKNCGVATSGDIFQRLEVDGVRYSHIVDPFTGLGTTNQALATVIARDCMTADSLATASTLVPPKKALELADRAQASVRLVQLENDRPAVYIHRRFPKLSETP